MNQVKWRKLDNSAKLFPIISNKKFSSVYRMSVVLTENIEEELLKKAANEALQHFASFRVKLRRGFFWYYFEENQKDVIVKLEKKHPCKFIEKKANNEYPFQITYFQNKLNVDVFHALTDGTTSIEFVKTIVYLYLNLKHPNQFTKNFSIKNVEADTENTEDSYLKNYEKNLPDNGSSAKAYLLKGRTLPFFATGVTHGFIELKPVIKTCRRLKVTVAQYFTAVLIHSIYQVQKRNKLSKRPIKICLPVNLKAYYDSTTVSNFFSYITLEAYWQKINLENFDEVLEFVSEDFKQRLNKQELAKTMSKTVKLGNSISIRMIPLFLKKAILKIVYGQIQKYTTTTFSNLGKINILPEYEDYIKTMFFLIAPENAERIKCTACSYQKHIVFTITSILEDPEIEKEFFAFLTKNDIPNKIVTNGVYKGSKKDYGKLYPKIEFALKNKVEDIKANSKQKKKVSWIEELKRRFHI